MGKKIISVIMAMVFVAQSIVCVKASAESIDTKPQVVVNSQKQDTELTSVIDAKDFNVIDTNTPKTVKKSVKSQDEKTVSNGKKIGKNLERFFGTINYYIATISSTQAFQFLFKVCSIILFIGQLKSGCEFLENIYKRVAIKN